MNSELEKYVQESKAKGVSDEAIRQELLKVGWSTELINQVLFSKVVPQIENTALPSPVITSPGITQIRQSHTSLFVVSAAILVLGVLTYIFLPSIFSYYYSKQTTPANLQEVPARATNEYVNELGFRFTMPSGWKEADIPRYSSEARIVFIRANDEEEFKKDIETPAAREGGAMAVIPNGRVFIVSPVTEQEVRDYISEYRNYRGTEITDEQIGQYVVKRVKSGPGYGGGYLDVYFFSSRFMITAPYADTGIGGELKVAMDQVLSTFEVFETIDSD